MKRNQAKNYIVSLMAVASFSMLIGCDKDSEIIYPLEISEIINTYYDGEKDGLIGGLGLSGIKGAAPGYVDIANPTKSELRKNTIFVNYTALVNQVDGQFGLSYGPTDDTKYAGFEYMAFVGEGINRATVMVQVPDSFNVENPCIIAAPSSGSRGVYGAIGTGGAWGIKKGCAVAYTDMNKGTGAVDLTQGLGYGIQKNALELETNEELTFRVPTQDNTPNPSEDYSSVSLPTQAQVKSYALDNANRYAFKHSHGQKNSEKDWGLYTLQSIKFAFNILNEKYENEFTPKNTLVIAASVSNGGAGVLRAAELDEESLIDAVVAAEPNVNPQASSSAFSIKMGNRDAITNHSKPGLEYWTVAERYAACASEAVSLKGTLLSEARGSVAPRCDAMVVAGVLPGGSYQELGQKSVDGLINAGYLTESHKLLVGYAGIDLFQSLTNTYANAYSRSSVVDNLCNVSMSTVGTDNKPNSNTTYQTLATESNGIPRTANLVLIKDDALGGAHKQSDATSANGTKDYNFSGAECFFDIYFNQLNPLNKRLKQGIAEIQASGRLQGKPVIMVHGRSDALIAVNHSSRPYYALSNLAQGENSNVYYYEVTNAQHLDTLNSLYNLGGMHFVPLDYYFKKSMDLMYEHLNSGKELPASQVVKAKAPEEGVLKLTDLVDIQIEPENRITFDGEALVIPE